MTQTFTTPLFLARLRQSLHRAAARFGTNLATGVRLALPFPAPAASTAATLGQLLAMIAMLAALGVVDDLAGAGLPAEFSPWGVISWAAISYFWLATIAGIVLVCRAERAYLSVSVTMASVLVVQFAVWSLIKNLSGFVGSPAFDDHYLTVWFVFLAWEVLAFLRVLARELNVRVIALLACASFYGAAVYAVLSLLPGSAIFVEPWEPVDAERPDVEATYYAQPNLLGQELYALSPERPGTVDLYFIGFAAYAHQDVFQREIEQATVIFERQFDAIGRTLSLINNPKTLHTVPLANRHNLERAVRGVADRIDRDEDILVLFLSSHGDDDATIAVDFRGFGMNDLSASDIREILDEHDIGWRIIIVSACYSGSFIEELASPRSLVITAAAADRSSFGCAHENDWTYFGEALFDHALRQSSSFVAAFDLARQRIAEREADEGKEASRPQIALGEEIAAYLEAHGL